ncbi:MAG: hypothetical protein V8S12_01375 [Lachnospiraceae bacterium]
MGAVAAEFIITTIKMVLLAAVGVEELHLANASGTKRMQNAAEKESGSGGFHLQKRQAVHRRINRESVWCK